MVTWYLNPALTTFRTEVNIWKPNRDKASDGTIGDLAHQGTNSDHNPDTDGSVDAWDMDVDLNGPGKPYASDVEYLKGVFQKHPAARYWIHNGQIARASTGWVREAYHGDNPHDKHVHFNSEPAYEKITTPWGVVPKNTTPPNVLEEKMLLAQVEGSPDVWVGNGVYRRKINLPSSVHALKARGYDATHTSSAYGGTAMIRNEAELTDFLGYDVDAEDAE